MQLVVMKTSKQGIEIWAVIQDRKLHSTHVSMEMAKTQAILVGQKQAYYTLEVYV